MTTLRPATQAGRFYPADPQALRDALAGHLASAAPPAAAEADHPPKLLVVPHAGYVYSGDVAGLAYAPLARWRERVSRVVLLGPVHRVPVQRAGGAHGQRLRDAARACAARSGARWPRWPICARWCWTDLPHEPEHSLEVQLPFLQSVLGERLHAGAAGGGPGQPVRGGRSAGAAVGRRRDADRDQLRPVALPALCRGAGQGPGDRAAHPSISPPTSRARRPAARRLSMARCWRRAATDWCRDSWACATRPTSPAATAAGWWATARSPSMPPPVRPGRRRRRAARWARRW